MAVEPADHVAEAVLARPLLADPGLGAQRVRPVDDGAAAEARAGLKRDVHVRRRHGSPAPVEVLIGPQLELVEVGLVEVAAELEDHDLHPAGGELRGDHAAARARADDHRVGLEGRLALDRQRGDPLWLVGRGGDRPRIAESRPVRVASGRRVGRAVGEHQRQAAERGHAARGAARRERHVAQQLLPRGLRRPAESLRRERVEQREQAGGLLVGERGEHADDGLVGAHRARRARPEPVRVRRVLKRRDERVADGAQRLPLRCGRFDGHGATLLRQGPDDLSNPTGAVRPGRRAQQCRSWVTDSPMPTTIRWLSPPHVSVHASVRPRIRAPRIAQLVAGGVSVALA